MDTPEIAQNEGIELKDEQNHCLIFLDDWNIRLLCVPNTHLNLNFFL
jgi:hypothetical protein